jgi:hypothetical protein
MLVQMNNSPWSRTKAMRVVVQDYGNHPCGTRFCRCGWILMPPAYPGDYWDCTNPEHEFSKPSSKSDIKKMWP